MPEASTDRGGDVNDPSPAVPVAGSDRRSLPLGHRAGPRRSGLPGRDGSRSPWRERCWS